MSSFRGDNTLLRLLEMIDTEMSMQMLSDLKNPEKRTPQLYQAINRFLDRHDFGIKTLMVDHGVMGDLQEKAAQAVAEFLKYELPEDEYLQ